MHARLLAAWCCIADGIFILAFVAVALMSCPPLNMHGSRSENGMIQASLFIIRGIQNLCGQFLTPPVSGVSLGEGF